MFQATQARGNQEGNAEAAPVAEFGENVFGDEGDLRVAADELELFGGRIGSDESETGGAVGRSDSDERAAGLYSSIESELETKFLDIESGAAIEIADKDGDGL